MNIRRNYDVKMQNSVKFRDGFDGDVKNAITRHKRDVFQETLTENREKLAETY